jgi:glycosyltransferase involved in cell wall biosynthesis
MAAQVRLLDLSRLFSRLGAGPATGIDRVELAYLDALLGRDTPCFALVRTAAVFCLLDRGGMMSAAALFRRGIGPSGPPDALARLTRRGDKRLALADTAARRLAVDRCLRPRLAAMLRRNLPAGTRYLNVGHSNLSPQVFAALHTLPQALAAVLVHDTIPLDHPEFTRAGRVEVFAQRMRAISAGADLVICNSAATRDSVTHHLTRFGRVPPLAVAHLGIDPPQAPDSALPAVLTQGGRPFFLTLGTIEARKNHALLLDAWDILAARMPAEALPRLAVVGRRGWRAEAMLARLDAARAGDTIIEMPGLSDAALAPLWREARALLFPTRAEGFGLPLAEAIAADCPAVCTPLPVFREIAGDYPVYLPPDDAYSWAGTIQNLAEVPRGAGRSGKATGRLAVPTWAAHFKTVFTLV